MEEVLLTYELLACSSCEFVVQHYEWFGFFFLEIIILGQSYNVIYLSKKKKVSYNVI